MAVLSLSQGCLEIRCQFFGDRYHCEFGILQSDHFTTILASVEGNNQDASPPSPPIQQAVLDDIGLDQKAILGVGMSGKSHWSLSIHWDQSSPQWIFDAACRCHEVIDTIGSTYKVSQGITLLSDSNRIIIRQDQQVIATLTAVDNCALALANDQIQIKAEPTPSIRFPQTIRYRYALQPAEKYDTSR